MELGRAKAGKAGTQPERPGRASGRPHPFPARPAGDRAWCARCRWTRFSNTWPKTSCSAFRGAPRTPTAKPGTSLQAEFEERLDRMRRQALQEGWLQPQGVYGYWPAQSEGNDLVVYEPGSVEAGSPAELTALYFPAPAIRTISCAWQIILPPVESGQDGRGGFPDRHGGDEASRALRAPAGCRRITAKPISAMAWPCKPPKPPPIICTHHIRRELGLPAEQGKRYSWGYPAIPELADHAKVFQLLPAESELKMQPDPRLPTGARTVHRGDHRAPPGGEVFQYRRKPHRAIDQVNLWTNPAFNRFLAFLNQIHPAVRIGWRHGHRPEPARGRLRRLFRCAQPDQPGPGGRNPSRIYRSRAQIHPDQHLRRQPLSSWRAMGWKQQVADINAAGVELAQADHPGLLQSRSDRRRRRPAGGAPGPVWPGPAGTGARRPSASKSRPWPRPGSIC